MMTRLLEADLTWTGRAFEPGLQVELRDDGTIGRVGHGIGKNTERLEGEALLPGMVNAHSHAFQRGLRGWGESYPEGSGDFWSWREAMYRLVETLDEESFYRMCCTAFREMLRAGITTVGEFHYVHHEQREDFAFDRVVLRAASDARIRLVLLDTCYLTGDVGQDLAPSQKRFDSSSVERFLESAEHLRSALAPGQSLGLVAHSLRAVPIESIARLHERARETGVVFHIYVEEQEREIDASVKHYGKRPLTLLLDELDVGPELTAVHCTHSTREDLDRLVATGASVCICPLTEANLADGIAPEALATAPNVCIGTDSNLRVSFLEELRLLEHSQRLGRQRRGIYKSPSGDVAERLFQIATEGGARSLGLRSGRIAEGYCADLFTIDRRHLTLSEIEPPDLLTGFIFGADEGAIQRVAVAGTWVV